MNKKVLVVDDDDCLLEFIINALELKFIFEVQGAMDDLEALEHLRQSQRPYSLNIDRLPNA